MTTLIKDKVGLEAVCAKARAESLLALDTEFVWTRTYRPQLGIVQLGCRAANEAVDAMCALDVSPLAALLADATVVKILHDARQDLMHLKHFTGTDAHAVFDTQLAAAFAGFPVGIGLQKLLFEALDVGLAKTETCTDWTRRPLSPAQVSYALDDVRYLPDLRDELLARADGLGTRAWLEEDLRTLDESQPEADVGPSAAWLRVKTGRTRLDGRGRAILRAVAACREETASKWNLPRGWLGDDGSLVAMAVNGRVGRLVHRLRGGQGDTLRVLYEAAIREALAQPEETWPDDPKPHYIAEVREAADAALAWLAARAEELHVAASVIANRATVMAFVDDVNDETNPLGSGWRYETVGREMAEKFGVD